MRHLAALLLVLAAFVPLLAGAGPAFADSRADLFRALDLERAEGDYSAALTLYRQAAETTDPAVRAEARLGEARCLRRLGRHEQARVVLDALISSSAPEKFRSAARSEREKLPGKVEPPPVEPSPPPDPDEQARMERELAAHVRKELTDWFVSQAVAFYREMRFDDARERLGKALALDPMHTGARDLFEKLGDTPGGRERLIAEVLRLLDYERDLRRAELEAEADARIAAGEASLRNGELDEAARRLDDCVRLIEGHSEFAAELTGRLRNATELRDRAITRGGRAPDRALPAPTVPDQPWRASLRELLIDMASAPPATAMLQLLDVILPPAPPDGEAGPDRFVHRGRPEGALDLLCRVIELGRRPDSRSFVRPVGGSLAVAGPSGFHDSVASELDRINARQGRPIRLQVLAVGLSPDDLSLVHGVVEFSDREGRSRSGRIENPEQAARFVTRFLSPEVGDVLAQTELALLPGAALGLSKLRGLNLPASDPVVTTSSGRIEYGIHLDLLTHRTRAGAVRIALSGQTTRVGNLLRLPFRGQTVTIPEMAFEEFRLAEELPEGGAWFVTGLGNPFHRDGDPARGTLLLIVRVLPAGESEPDTPEPPRSTGPVPVDLRGLDSSPPDDPSPAFRGEGPRATESREGFLLHHLWSRLGRDTLTLSHGAAWVGQDEELIERTRAAIAGLKADQKRLYRVRVRAAVLTTAEEERIASGRSEVGTVHSGDGVRVASISGDDLRRVGYLISGAEGRYPLPRESLYARPTQLIHTLRSTRYNYLSGFLSGPTGSKTDAFPVYDSVEEGLAVEIRPVPGEDGRIDLTIRVRVARILDRETESDRPVRPERPVLTVAEARFTATVAPDSSLLVTGLPAPTPERDRRERLVLLLEATEAEMPK